MVARDGVGTAVLVGATAAAGGGIVGAATSSQVGPWLAFSAALIVAVITAITTDRRQKAALDAESNRLSQRLRHERTLADVADLRSVLEGALDGLDAEDIVMKKLWAAHHAEEQVPHELDEKGMAASEASLGWLNRLAVSGQVAERETEQEARLAALAVKRAELADLDRKVALARAGYDEALGSDLAATALRQLARLEATRDEQAQTIQQAEAVIGEWSGPPDLDAALDWYSGLVDLVRGKVTAADGVKELNVALATVIASIEMELVDSRLHAEFRLHVPDGQYGPFTLSHDDDTDRMRAYFEQRSEATTVRHTFVYRCLTASRSRPASIATAACASA